MSVLIKGLKLPKSCGECIFDVWGACLINLNTEPKNKLTHSCPLIELPDHGNLIDIDALKKSLIDEGETIGIDGFSIDGLSTDDVCYAIENAPVVIPAERSEE